MLGLAGGLGYSAVLGSKKPIVVIALLYCVLSAVQLGAAARLLRSGGGQDARASSWMGTTRTRAWHETRGP